MNEKALHILEYDKIISRLTDFASSPLGKEQCRKLTPMTDLSEINKAQEETEDAVARLLRKSRVTFQGNHDLFRTIKNLELGASLNASELLKIAALTECAQAVKDYGKKEREDEPDDSLTALFDSLKTFPALAREIRRCIISEEEISDDASSTLRKIRQSKISTGEKIHTRLNQMVSDTYRTYLQDAVITMRNNRYCIPVKSEYKSSVNGMVHDQSKAGSTFFIEPAAIVELNNRIQELEAEEKEEIEKILATLSALAGEHCAELIENSNLLTTLDFIFAKAGLALSQNATRPEFNNDHILHIRKGRHPLIDKKKCVPIDIILGETFDLLIVTGPNTGGKTVSLKTTGLLSAMGQSGLHIPASSGSRLCIFHNIFADIGDEQSIEQNLSTFSSHMTNIISILEKADEYSLCLFDELCSGTDPTEGAALAISILRFLHDRGIRTMATTHYSELKVFALSTGYVENACCEFDLETLSPTYRLLIGIPGKSNAFAISRKLGLPEEIIENAREEMTQSQESFEDLLTDLENSRKTIEQEKERVEAYRKEMEELKNRISEKSRKFEETKEQILKEAHEEAREILRDAKETADEAIRVYQKGSTIQEMEKARTRLRTQINARDDSLRKKAEKPTHKLLKPTDIKTGDDVRIISLNLKGIVSTLPDAKGNLFVQCGIMKTKANINDLCLLMPENEYKTAGKKTATFHARGLSKASTISPEINLLGLTADEAIAKLDKYLDDAYLSHLPSVRVVHGKGTGVLRNAVHQHVKKLKYVNSYRLGEQGEGDAGVTIVTFK